jgi:hypothetical protein
VEAGAGNGVVGSDSEAEATTVEEEEAEADAASEGAGRCMWWLEAWRSRLRLTPASNARGSIVSCFASSFSMKATAPNWM